jgi:hypothetical protein
LVYIFIYISIIYFLACPRASADYRLAPTYHDETRISGCTGSNSCNEPYECTPVASQQLCCLSPKSICSSSGGRPNDPRFKSRLTIFDAGLSISDVLPTGVDIGRQPFEKRYYYDPTDGLCRSFDYGGFLGIFELSYYLSNYLISRQLQ